MTGEYRYRFVEGLDVWVWCKGGSFDVQGYRDKNPILEFCRFREVDRSRTRVI